jgi:hypothetical protein
VQLQKPALNIFLIAKPDMVRPPLICRFVLAMTCSDGRLAQLLDLLSLPFWLQDGV